MVGYYHNSDIIQKKNRSNRAVVAYMYTQSTVIICKQSVSNTKSHTKLYSNFNVWIITSKNCIVYTEIPNLFLKICYIFFPITNVYKVKVDDQIFTAGKY